MTDEVKVKPFELIIGERHGEILNGDVPVRWCVTPELVAEMEKDGIDDPHILLISYIKGTCKEMDRKLIPLTELMTYVRFTRSGEHTLASWIVSANQITNDVAANGRVRLKNALLKERKDYTKWENHTEVPRNQIEDFSYMKCHTTVTIPDGAFAKEPPAWLRWFGNLWHEKRVVDQCNFRQRCVLAFTLKWIPMLCWIGISIAIKSLMVFAMTLCGWFRAPNYRGMFRPFDQGLDYFIDTSEMKIADHPFTFQKDWCRDSCYRGKQTFLSLLPFIPVFPILVWVVSLAVKDGHLVDATVVTAFAMSFFVFVAAMFDAISACFYYCANSHIGDRFAKAFHKLDMHLAETGNWPYVIMGVVATVVLSFILLLIYSLIFQIVIGFFVFAATLTVGSFKLFEWMLARNLEKNDYTQIRELLCPRDPLNAEAKYDLIPAKQRTVHLWVAKIKNKVCKPMQY